MTLLEPVRAVDGSAILGALDRAASGERLGVDDAETLLSAEGAQFERMLELAGAARDAGLAASGRPGVITYSRKVFIPLTTLCRDRCHYCIFVDTPGQLLTLHKPVVHVRRTGARRRAPGRGDRVQGSAADPRRPPRGSLARGTCVAR